MRASLVAITLVGSCLLLASTAQAHGGGHSGNSSARAASGGHTGPIRGGMHGSMHGGYHDGSLHNGGMHSRPGNTGTQTRQAPRSTTPSAKSPELEKDRRSLAGDEQAPRVRTGSIKRMQSKRPSRFRSKTPEPVKTDLTT